MRISEFLQSILDKDIITAQQYEVLSNDATSRPISLHWEIRILLLAGITMLCSGLGTLIYKNIDTIGHQAIIVLIALATIACGWYVYKKRQPFLAKTLQNEHTLADNALLLGCSLFLILEGYLQYQYQIFGTHYGIATLIPMLLFFFCAYRFDHIGVLTMAMTAFVSWAGLTATPLSIFQEDVFRHEPTLIHTGIACGVMLAASGLILNYRLIKPHFTFSYLNFGFNLACIATLYGAFSISQTPYCLLCLCFCGLGIMYARLEKSPFFLVAGAIYGYIAFTTLISKFNFNFEGWMLYGVISCFAIIMFFLNYKKILKP